MRPPKFARKDDPLAVGAVVGVAHLPISEEGELGGGRPSVCGYRVDLTLSGPGGVAQIGNPYAYSREGRSEVIA